MFKFLHAADIHLDSPMLGLDRYEGAPASECREAGRRALENLVGLAIDERVAFVLIVGDLYDGDWPDYNTGLFFSAQMARLRDEGIEVYLIRGNHDAANRMTKDLRPLSNVKFLSDRRPESIVLDDLDVAIHGQSYPQSAVTENLAQSYPERVPGRFNIGLLHTGVEGREGHARYAPCVLNDLRRHDYDYWALGHIHKRETLIAADPVVAFPGNLQGRNVRESGPKGCLLVTVDDAGRVTVENRWLDVLRWGVCRVDASGARDGDDLLARFRERLGLMLPECDDRLLALRVEFHGACPAHGETSSNWPYWSNELRQTATDAGSGRVWVEKVVARTASPPVPIDPEDDGPRAELAALLAELRNEPNRLRAMFDRELVDVRKKAPWLLEELETPERLRDLLEQVEPLLLGRLDGVSGSVPP
ncbi:MAG: exonuclease SbcCD subunit D [Isosphaeraceae bacterium]